MDDPFSLLAVALWTLATGMYPLGFMFGVCSACCDDEECSLPTLPDSIEIEITSGDSQYGSMAFEGGLVGVPASQKQFASAAVWTIPGGVYVLEPTSPGSSTYQYSNTTIGIDSLEVVFSSTLGGYSITFSAILSIMRQRTLVDTLTPPAEEDLLADDWLQGESIDDLHALFQANNMMFLIPASYRFYKNSFGSGSATRLTSNWTVSELCDNAETTRSVSANATFVNSGHSVCSEPGCVFPLEIQANQQNAELPRQVAPSASMNLFFPFASHSGTRPNGGNNASGKATATFESMSMVYGNDRTSLFVPPIGDTVCSSFNNAGSGSKVGVTLDESVVPDAC